VFNPSLRNIGVSRNVKHCLWSLLLLLPGISPADNAFEGTWVMRPDLTTFSPHTVDFLIERSTYRRTDCGDPIEVAANGADQPVDRQPLFDSMTVRLADRYKVEVTQKLKGKLAWKGTYTVSRDQRQMTLDYEDDRASSPVTGTIQYSRIGEPLPGAHSLSGSWRAEKLIHLSPSALTLRIEILGKGMGLQWSDGRRVESNLDGKYYPLNGYLPEAGVSVLHDRPDLLALNRAQNNVAVEVSRAQLSGDSQTLSYAQVDWLCRKTVNFSYRRQAEMTPAP
jgi:hypothetical protein